MCVLEQRGISSRAIERWTVRGSVGFIPALKREAFSSILRKGARSTREGVGRDEGDRREPDGRGRRGWGGVRRGPASGASGSTEVAARTAKRAGTSSGGRGAGRDSKGQSPDYIRLSPGDARLPEGPRPSLPVARRATLSRGGRRRPRELRSREPIRTQSVLMTTKAPQRGSGATE